MRQLMLTAEEFDAFVFPCVTQGSGVENDSEWETAIRLVRTLKDPGLTRDKAFSKGDQEAIAGGAHLRHSKVLLEAQATFAIEEDCITMLERRLRANRKGVPFGVAEEFEALLKKVKDAPVMAVEAQA